MKQLEGIVTSTKMHKTAVVTDTRKKVHPLYGKSISVSKKYHVHDELGVKVGQKVKVLQTRPISKTKKWKISQIV